MKKKYLTQLLMIVALVLVIYPSFRVQGKVLNFSTTNMDINVPEDTIILTKDTPNADEQWKKVGINDPKSEKKAFDEMGVLAILYDPDTNSLVRLLQKQTTDSKDVFHLSLLSEDELSEFMDSLITSSDENTIIEVEKYPQKETPFFRLSVETTNNGVPLKEIVYGTIVNGYSISFDLFKENSAEPLDESYIKELVTAAHFTEFLDKAEVAKLEKDSMIRFFISILIFVGIVVAYILIQKRKRKKQKALKKIKAGKMELFYRSQKEKEERNEKSTLYFVNQTKYTEEVVKNYSYYTNIAKNYKYLFVFGLLFLVLLFNLFQNSSSLSVFIAIVLLFVIIYIVSIQIENSAKNIMKSYKNSKSMDAVFRFYEDYFTMSGIQYLSKYPYVQITDVKEYKGYIYLYMGTEKAVYLKKDCFEEGGDEFLTFIKQHVEK